MFETGPGREVRTSISHLLTRLTNVKYAIHQTLNTNEPVYKIFERVYFGHVNIKKE